MRDGDPIRAVIRETGLNQDGRTTTITAPDDGAQARLIRECYEKAGIDPSLTAYVEAHGTGTSIGDPLEMSAISMAFATDQNPGRNLLVGSLKPNIGHTEATSGLASIIKVALALEKGLIPPTANLNIPNPKLKLDERNIKIPTSVQPWELTRGTRQASINNFGFGGANAHAILEFHNPRAAGRKNGNFHNIDMQNKARVYVISAKDENSCKQAILRLKEYLTQDLKHTDEAAFLDSLAHTLGSRRSRFPWSAALTATGLPDLVVQLDNEKLRPRRAVQGQVQPRLGWVFTGQGAQWHAMGRELFKVYPIFKDAIMECDGYIREMGATWTIMGTY